MNIIRSTAVETELWELFEFQGLPWCFGVTQAGRLISGYWKLRAAVSTGQDCTIPPPPPPHPACAMGQHKSDLRICSPIFPSALYVCAPQVTKN